MDLKGWVISIISAYIKTLLDLNYNFFTLTLSNTKDLKCEIFINIATVHIKTRSSHTQSAILLNIHYTSVTRFINA